MPCQFSKDSEVEFAKLKEALTTASILHPFVLGESFELTCDAFDCAIRLVLRQTIDNMPHVI